jgi:hypothetical protein
MQALAKLTPVKLLLCLPLLSLGGCASLPDASSGKAESKTAAATAASAPSTPEAQLLVALDGAAPGADIVLPEGVRAVADEAYAAASGRWCRAVRLNYPDGRVAQRLACKISGQWQWAPAVTLTLSD